MKRLLTIFFSILFCGQVFAAGNIIDRWATDSETTAQTRDDVGLTPANIPSIMAAPGTVSELKLDHTVETLNADRTILITDKSVLWFDCNGSDRNVTLCPMASNSTDLVFTIVNRSDGAGEDLVIKDGNATPVTLFTIGPKQGQKFSCDGTDWEAWFDSGIYYDGITGVPAVTTNDTEKSALTIRTSGGIKGFKIYAGGAVAPDANYPYIRAGSHVYFGSKSGYDVFFCIGSATKMTLDNTGFLGLGTTSPDTLFELQKESADAEETISVYHDTEATAPIITLRKADNNATAPALVDDNAVLGRINFKGHDGTGWHTGAYVEGRVDGTPSDGTDMPTELVFATTADGAGSPTERMVIGPDGEVSIAGDLTVDNRIMPITLASDDTASGDIITVTYGESVVLGQLCYPDATDNEWKLALGTNVAVTVPSMGIALETKANGESGKMLLRGTIRDATYFSGVVMGDILYLSDSVAGNYVTTAPSDTGDIVQIVGFAIAANYIYFNPDYTYVEVP